jgi:hypothetical protein
MAAVVSGRQTASGEQRGQGVAAEHATNGTHGTYGAAGVHRRRARARARAHAHAHAHAHARRRPRARLVNSGEFGGYLHSEAPSSGHFETLGEHGFEDDFSGFAALAPAADQTDHNALNDQFLGGDQIGIQRVLGL